MHPSQKAWPQGRSSTALARAMDPRQIWQLASFSALLGRLRLSRFTAAGKTPRFAFSRSRLSIWSYVMLLGARLLVPSLTKDANMFSKGNPKSKGGKSSCCSLDPVLCGNRVEVLCT
mmetsp:Transcript_1156/g.2752  ORF Transcript_1156/g.2752 Transcript_1156/m.2752 type:complete len:117 (+) Transcript_1156:230-580(+)